MIERTAAELHRALPFYEATRSAELLRRLLELPAVRRALGSHG